MQANRRRTDDPLMAQRAIIPQLPHSIRCESWPLHASDLILD